MKVHYLIISCTVILPDHKHSLSGGEVACSPRATSNDIPFGSPEIPRKGLAFWFARPIRKTQPSHKKQFMPTALLMPPKRGQAPNKLQLFQYGEWNQENGTFILNQEAIARLGKLNVHDRTKCQVCIAKYNCAGDCYAKSASATGDPASAGYTERCHITRELLKDNLVIGLISKLAGAHASPVDQHACRM